MTPREHTPSRELIRSKCLFFGSKRRNAPSDAELREYLRLSRAVDGRTGSAITEFSDPDAADRAVSVLREIIEAEPVPGRPTCREIEATSAICRRCRHRGFIKSPLELGDDRPKVHAISARDLDALELDPPKMIVENLIPAGLSILAGRPKRGKSWMALSIALSVASGGPALGSEKVCRGSVLVGALEDSPARMKSRLARLLGDGETLPVGLHLMNQAPRIGAGLLEALTSWLDAHDDAAMIVLDTYQKIRAPRARGVDPYEADYAALEGLQRLALERGIGIVVLHHTRKASKEGDSDPFDTIHGSTAIFGVADAALVIAPSPAGQNGAILHVTARDFSADDRALTFDEGIWTIDANTRPAEFALASGRKAILDLIRARGPLAPKEMLESLSGTSYGNLRKTLTLMREAGQVFQDGRGGKYFLNKGNSNNGNNSNNSNISNNGNIESVSEPLLPLLLDTYKGSNNAKPSVNADLQPIVTDVTDVTVHVTETPNPEPRKRETKKERAARELQERVSALSPEARVIVSKIRRRTSDLPANDPDRVSLEKAIENAAEHPERAERVLEAAVISFIPPANVN